jgi:hypothetical protein
VTDTNSLLEPTDARSAAIKRLSARRDFAMHLVTYIVVNAALVMIWLATGHGYFWPGWVIGGWGIGLALHGWEIYVRRPITEEDIAREMRRHPGDA